MIGVPGGAAPLRSRMAPPPTEVKSTVTMPAIAGTAAITSEKIIVMIRLFIGFCPLKRQLLYKLLSALRLVVAGEGKFPSPATPGITSFAPVAEPWAPIGRWGRK